MAWSDQGAGLVVVFDCVCVLTLYGRVFVCVYCVCVCAVCLAASRGCGISVEVVGVVFLCPDHCAEEWEDEKEVKSMASEGWLATANCICTISDKVPLCVVVLGSNSWGLPTKSNSLIVKHVCVFLWDHVHAGDYICTRAGVCVCTHVCVCQRDRVCVSNYKLLYKCAESRPGQKG